MKETKSTYFENIDGLRSIAFFWVFLYHCVKYFKYNGHSVIETSILEHIADKGFLGVNLFFVLSGFLITHLLLNEKTTNGSIHISGFYLRRVLRIWPLYYLIVILSFIVIPVLTHRFDSSLLEQHGLSYLFFLNNFDRLHTGFAGIGNDNLGVMWSIAVEEQFYFFWPLFLAFIHRKWLPLFFLITIVASILFRWENVDNPRVIYLHSFSLMSDLAVGGLIAYLAFYKEGFRQFFNSLSKSSIVFVYLAGLFFILLVSSRLHFQVYSACERFLFSLFFGFVIAEQCYAQNSIFKFKNSAILSKTGLVTYGLYCFHLYSIMLLQKLNIYLSINIQSPLVFYTEAIVCLLLSIIVAKWSYTYFESYFLKMKKRFY